MTDGAHKFRVGQTVDLIPSISRSAAAGHYEIVSLRPADGGIRNIASKAKANLTSASFPRAILFSRRT